MTGSPDCGTIVAIVTPEGLGGLAVVRLSGQDSIGIARRLLPGGELDDPVQSHRARLAGVRWPRGEPGSPCRGGAIEPGTELDRALVLPFLAPASYTGEDTVEFFCHGGLMPARLVLAACRAAGARAAAAGEFTRRAFLNGRLSLSQAEAVADLIAAECAAGARAALAQLEGGLKRELEAVEAPLLRLLARLEGSLEFEEHELAGPPPEEVRDVLAGAREQIRQMLSLAPAGRQLREGVQVVIAGPPNAGKSSLFNALLDRPRALVDAQPGTTRDVVTANLELGGLLFVLHDTAGLRERSGGVEALGIDRAHGALSQADIVLDVRPVDAPDDGPDAGPPVPDGSVRIMVATKGDLGQSSRGHVTSSLTGEGIAELKSILLVEARRSGVDRAVSQGVLLNLRHQDRLLCCLTRLDDLLGGAVLPDEVAATVLSGILEELGEVSGRVFSERLLDEIFSRFCVGK